MKKVLLITLTLVWLVGSVFSQRALAVCGNVNGTGGIDMSDLSALVAYVYGTYTPGQVRDANVNGSCRANIADACALMNYLFGGGFPFLSCADTAACSLAPATGNRVRVVCPPTVYPGGDSLAVTIRLTNNVAIYGGSIGLSYPTTGKIRSWITSGSVVSSINVRSDSANYKVQVTWGPSSPLSPQSDGLLITLNVLVPNGVTCLDMDSAFVAPAGDFIFVRDYGYDLRPEFEKCECCTVGSPCQPSFSVAKSADTADAFYLQQADLDMDNYADFVYTGLVSDSLFVAYGKSDGSLEKPQAYFKIKKTAVAVDYINGDTLLDIVARSTSQVYVLLNSGNRNYSIDSFALSSMAYGRQPLSSTFPSISTGYFNNDASKDIVASPGTIFFGNGSGGFPSNATLTGTFDGVSAADFDDDGFDDLAMTVGDSTLIFLNDGTGGMTRSAAVRTGYHPFDVSRVLSGVDFNADGKVDFVAVTGQSAPGPNDTSVVTVALGDGTGGITSSDTLKLLGSAIEIAVNDVNRDKILDLAVVNARTRTLQVYEGDGLGGFPTSLGTTLTSGSQPLLTVATADFNRDGNPDYLVGGGVDPLIQATSLILPVPVQPQEMVVTGYGGIDFSVHNPLDHVIARNIQTVAASAFWRSDINHDGKFDERSFDYNLLLGEYKFIIRFPPYFTPGGPFTMDIRVDGSQQIRPFLGYALPTFRTMSPDAADSLVFYYTPETVSSMNPPNGLRTNNRQPAFLWGRLVDTVHSTRYHVQLSPYFDLSSPLYNDSTPTRAQFVPSVPLDTGRVYYWRARAYDGVSWSPWTRTMAAYVGAGCCVGFRGNVDAQGIIDGADLAGLVNYLTTIGLVLPCFDEANVDGKGIIDSADLAGLVAYLTGGGFVIPVCP